MTDFGICKLVLAMQLNGFICLSYTPVRDKILFIKSWSSHKYFAHL